MASSTHKIKATRRSDAGKGASRRLRRSGQVPAVLYGGDKTPLSIQLDHEDTILAAKNQWFFSSVLDLDIEGEMQRVLVRDWQMHPYKQHMLHLDFLRIDENAEIHVHVPLNFLNQENSPAGKTAGVVISHNQTEVEVACLSKDLPEQIDVDLANLEVGDIIHMSDLKLPEGVELVAMRLEDAHDLAVTGAQAIKVEAEPAEDAAEGDAEADTADKPESED